MKNDYMYDRKLGKFIERPTNFKFVISNEEVIRYASCKTFHKSYVVMDKFVEKSSYNKEMAYNLGGLLSYELVGEISKYIFFYLQILNTDFNKFKITIRYNDSNFGNEIYIVINSEVIKEILESSEKFSKSQIDSFLSPMITSLDFHMLKWVNDTRLKNTYKHFEYFPKIYKFDNVYHIELSNHVNIGLIDAVKESGIKILDGESKSLYDMFIDMIVSQNENCIKFEFNRDYFLNPNKYGSMTIRNKDNMYMHFIAYFGCRMYRKKYDQFVSNCKNTLIDLALKFMSQVIFIHNLPEDCIKNVKVRHKLFNKDKYFICIKIKNKYKGEIPWLKKMY